MLYAHIKNGKVFRELDLDPTKVPASKANYLKPIVRDDMPVINNVMQVNEGRTVTIEANQVRYGWRIRDKTQSEKDDDAVSLKVVADSRVDEDMDQQLGKALFVLANQIRLLNKGEKFTKDQFRRWVKGL